MKRVILALIILLSGVAALAQTSVPPPGTGSIAPPAGMAWGSPWFTPAWNIVRNLNPPAITNPNQGKESVVAVGYDDRGVWRSVPMSVEYTYTGTRYSVVVLTAWNPWADEWDKNLNIPAVNTTYRLNGYTCHFYADLSTGTYYFNLGQ